MAQIVKLIKARQESTDMGIEEYANHIGIRGVTLWRYYNLERRISLPIVQRLAKYYNDMGDSEMVNALASYALNLNDASLK